MACFLKSIIPFYYRQGQSFMFREGDRYSAFIWSVSPATATFLIDSKFSLQRIRPYLGYFSAKECILPFISTYLTLWCRLLFDEGIICYSPQSTASKPLCVSHLQPKLIIIYHLQKFTRLRDSSSYCLHFFYILIFRQQMPCIGAWFSLRWKLLTLSSTEPILASPSPVPF